MSFSNLVSDQMTGRKPDDLYNPCRNRHCPKCQGVTRAAWLANRQREVLDTAYVHSIFTLPQDLRPLVLYNPCQLYGLLFRTVSQRPF